MDWLETPTPPIQANWQNDWKNDDKVEVICSGTKISLNKSALFDVISYYLVIFLYM